MGATGDGPYRGGRLVVDPTRSISAAQRPDLALTGERTLPDIWHENYWFQRHLAAYEHVRAAEPRGVVLDAGCGEGYGAHLLAARCCAVVAMDYDAATAAHVRRRYPGLATVRGNLVALPLRDRSVDWVVSLQTVEHLWDVDQFLSECLRVLRRDGTLVVSTPNRLTFSPGLALEDKPANPFHHREFSARDLLDLMSAHAATGDVTGLRHGDVITSWEAQHGSIVEAQLAKPQGSWDPDLVRLVSSLTTADFTLTNSDLTSCLDLVAFISAGAQEPDIGAPSDE